LDILLSPPSPPFARQPSSKKPSDCAATFAEATSGAWPALATAAHQALAKARWLRTTAGDERKSKAVGDTRTPPQLQRDRDSPEDSLCMICTGLGFALLSFVQVTET
jgi:hypothetical protein